MYVDYYDIVGRISEDPKWWLDGVPRYCDFSPRAATIYGDEVALVDSACQACGQRFTVAVVNDLRGDPTATMALGIREGRIGVGDPPNIGCCQAGPTMNSDELHIIEYWFVNPEHEWQRDPSLEIDLEDAKRAVE